MPQILPIGTDFGGGSVATGQRGVDLASAFVTIVPSLKGAQRQIQSQLAGVDLTPTGSKLGEQLSMSVGKSMDLKTIGAKFKDVGGKITGVGRKLTNSITKPAAIAAGAVGGLVATLGFKRLVGLDRAQAQFKGLGYDVEAVMEQVDKGVTNTALSMAEGASLAVAALATSNLPLEDLEAQIKRVSNVSAAYGIEAEHAGYLLNNVLTKNKVTWGDLAQMQQNNIPIVSLLAEKYGVAGDEIMKMAQDGKISIEDLNEVLDKNAGAAAEEYAKSWDGIRANIVANIGRIGAAFLEGVFPQAKEEMELFLEKLRSPEWTEKARELGEKVAAGFELVREKVRELIDAWNALDDDTKDWIVKLSLAAVAAGPFLVVVGKLVTGIGGLATGLGTVVGWLGNKGILGALGRLVLPVGIAAGLFKLLYDNSEDLRDAVAELWEALKDAGKEIWEELGPALRDLWEAVEPLIPVIGSMLAGAIRLLIPAVKKFAEEAVPVLKEAIGFLEKVATALDTDEFQTTMGKTIQITKTSGDLLRDVWSFTTKVMRGDWKGAWAEMHEKAVEVAPKIRSKISELGDNIRSTVSGFMDRVNSDWRSKWEAVRTAAVAIFERVDAGAREKLDALLGFLRNVPTRIKNIFIGAGSWLLAAGRQIIDGLVRGISSAFDRVRSKLGELTSMLPSWKGPPSKDRVILHGAGQMVIQGFVDGLESQYQNARRSLGGFTGSLAAAPVALQGAMPGMSSGGGPGVNVTQQIYANDTEEIVQEANGRMFQFLREAGVL